MKISLIYLGSMAAMALFGYVCHTWPPNSRLAQAPETDLAATAEDIAAFEQARADLAAGRVPLDGSSA